MGRKGKILNRILIMASVLSSLSCIRMDEPGNGMKVTMEIRLCPYGYQTRAEHNDAHIYDLNVIAFEDGKTDSMIWKEFDGNDSGAKMTMSLFKGHTYSFFAVANYGRALANVKERGDLYKEHFELTDTRDICLRMPMTAWSEDVVAEEGGTVRMELIRLAAKISISIDRSMLDKNVSVRAVGVRMGNCPGKAPLDGISRIRDRYDCLEEGFELKESECSPLNAIDKDGLSGEADLYMLENKQGEFPVKIRDAEEKVFADGDPMAEKCSYIELEMEYTSGSLISYDSNLIYRFYLGDSLNNLDVERNCHYHMTVIPVGDGLSGGGWRVDKSGIGPSTPFLDIYPGEYIEGHVGDILRIWCEYYPRSAPFDPGIEELEFDRKRGIYDYEIDEEGRGVTLRLKSPGTGLVYMSAGEPVNLSGMTIITVYP